MFYLRSPKRSDTYSGNYLRQVRMQDDGQLSYHQFDAVPHPPIKPMAYSGGFSGNLN
jgi:hypothetical protein